MTLNFGATMSATILKNEEILSEDQLHHMNQGQAADGEEQKCKRPRSYKQAVGNRRKE